MRDLSYYLCVQIFKRIDQVGVELFQFGFFLRQI